MARATLTEVAEKIAVAIQSGAIQREVQYSLFAFAKIVGCSRVAVLKVLEIGQILDQTACHISAAKLITSESKRSHYAIKVSSALPAVPDSVKVTYTLSSKKTGE